jgi:hypothetical protein
MAAKGRIIRNQIITSVIFVTLAVLLVLTGSSSGAGIEEANMSTITGEDALLSPLEHGEQDCSAVETGLPPWEELVLVAEEVYR